MYISLMTNDVEYLILCLLAILYMFFGEISVQILCPFFKTGLLIFLLV